MLPDSTHQPEYFATIEPVDPRYARRIMRTSKAIEMNFLMILFQFTWIVVLVLGYVLSSLLTGVLSTLVLVVTGIVALTHLAMLIASVFTFPEFPVNLWLCGQVRRALRARAEGTGQFFFDRSALDDPSIPVVDMVPRERWHKFALETAVDMGAIQIHEDGMWIEGDVYRYNLPAASILGASVESMTPTGWMCPAIMMIVFARGADGPIEIPMTLRDARWGQLRSSRRAERAESLVQQIQAIARGTEYESPMEVSPSTDNSLANNRVIDTNPYAPPAIVR